jgi:dolichyl-phosphate-mannose--protein O-mannosyl transferase
LKTYIAATGVAFGLLTVAHVWRVIEEGTGLLRQPFWVLITLVAAAFCIWAFWLLGRQPPPGH